MFHTVSLGRIDQCFALHEHVNCISSYKEESRDVFQCLIERSWIIEIDKARCPKLIYEIVQIRFSSRPYRKVCVTPSQILGDKFSYLSCYPQHEQVA